MIHLQVRIDVLELAGHSDLRQNLGAHRDVEAFGAFDFLPRFLDIGIALQRGEDRLIQSKSRHDGLAETQLSERLSPREKQGREGHRRQKRGAEQETSRSFSHG